MKHLFLLLLTISVFIANPAKAIDNNMLLITARDKIKCGTDLSIKSYAYRDDGGFWRGIDADLCKVFATALLGKSDAFQMVHVADKRASVALAKKEIDIMLGSKSYTASEEAEGLLTPIEISYYDKQMFLAKKKDGATSMEAYKGVNVCSTYNSENLFNLENYSDKYKLDLRILKFGSLKGAKEAFLLNRCDLLSANVMYLKSIPINDNVILLPETIATMPMYILTSKNNKSLNLAIKWVMNAITLAERQDINMQNIGIWIGTKDVSTKNLLGIEASLWKKLGLKSDWVNKAIAQFGNYGEIYDRNLGENSELNIPREKNNLVENGGLISPLPFL